MLDKPNWYDLLFESGICPVLPYVEWPSNILNFVEITLSLNCTPVVVDDPDTTRSVFLYKPIKDYKKKFYPLKSTLLMLDSEMWRPIIIQPLIVRGGADSVYKVTTTENVSIYTPADEFKFRDFLNIRKDAVLYGMIKN